MNCRRIRSRGEAMRPPLPFRLPAASQYGDAWAWTCSLFFSENNKRTKAYTLVRLLL